MEMKVRSITKSAKRKVNLQAISIEYDNIEWGTFITADIAYETEEEFALANDLLATKARKAVERDIRNYFIVLQHMSKDKRNEALIGNGSSLAINDGEIDLLLDESIQPLPADPTEDDKTNIKEESPKKKKETKKKETKKKDPEPEIIEDDSNLEDINDLLMGDAEEEEVKPIKEEPKLAEPKPKEKKTEEDDGMDDLDFLDDLGINSDDKSEVKKKEEPEELDEDEPDEKSTEYEEVDLEEFDFNDAAGDLFDD